MVSRGLLTPPRVFLHYLNPELLALYGVPGSFSARTTLANAVYLTRYAVVCSQRPLVMPVSYLFEVEPMGRFLRAISPIRTAGLLEIASPSPDLRDYASKKIEEYRDEPLLFPSYQSREPAPVEHRNLLWTPRVKRSSSKDIAAEWNSALSDEDGLWNEILREQAPAGSPSRIEGAISTVPARLEGRAFVARYAQPLLPFLPEPRHATQINLLINRAYLKSYLDELAAVILVDTPLGDLSCGLQPMDPDGSLRTISFRRVHAFMRSLGGANLFDHVFTWSDLLCLREELSFVWLLERLVLAGPIGSSIFRNVAVRSGLLDGDAMAPSSRGIGLSWLLGRVKKLREACDILDPVARGAPQLGPVPARRARFRKDRLLQDDMFKGGDEMEGPDPRNVFLVFGRDAKAAGGMKVLLRAAGLNPIDWEEAVRMTGKGSPYVLEVIEAGFKNARAAVVLFTPDECVSLREGLRRTKAEDESGFQARPNVLLEAGMALALFPDRTIVVEIGNTRPLSDLQGLHTVRFDASADKRHALVKRLETAGCECKTTSSDYLVSPGFEYLAAKP